MSSEIGYITVAGNSIGIVGLKAILQQVAGLGIGDEKRLKEQLIHRARAENYISDRSEAGYAQALLQAYRDFLSDQLNRKDEGLTIRILGPGCPACDHLTTETINALAELQSAASVEHVRDPAAIAQHGCLATPALVINGKVRSSGQVPSREKIKKWLGELR